MEEQAKYNKNTTMGEMEEYKSTCNKLNNLSEKTETELLRVFDKVKARDYTDVILCELSKPKSALGTQIGGDHYKTMKIQPITFIMENNLSFAVGNIIKYVCRYDKKNGLEDIQKARQYLNFLEEKYNKDNNGQ